MSNDSTPMTTVTTTVSTDDCITAESPLDVASICRLLSKEGYTPAAVAKWKRENLILGVGRFQGRVIFIDGLIGAGKSTALTQWTLAFASTRNPRTGRPYKVISVTEPVEKWRTVGILERFYKDPKTHAYAFQTYTFVTRVQAIIEAIKNCPDADVLLVERSVFTDRYVFMHLQRPTVGELTMQMYMEWFQLHEQLLPFSLASSTFVYLRPNLVSCMQRVEHRARPEEKCDDSGNAAPTDVVAAQKKAAAGGVSMEYQEMLSDAHDRLFLRGYLMSVLCTTAVVQKGGPLQLFVKDVVNCIYDYAVATDDVLHPTCPYDAPPCDLVDVVVVPQSLADDDFTTPTSPGRNRMIQYLFEQTRLL